MIPYTSIPLISACFLVMVGVLIGHLIWYRYRDEQEQKAADLHRQIDGLRSSLDVQSTDTAEARVRMSEIEGVLAAERDATAELQSRLESNETLYESAAADLEKSEQVNQQLRQQIAQQVETLGEIRGHAEQSSSKIGQLEDQLSKHSARAADEIQAVRDQLQSALEANEAANRQLAHRDDRIAEMEDSVGRSQQHVEAANAEVSRLSELLQRRDAMLTEQSHELEDASTLRQERDALQATLREAQRELELLRVEASDSNQQHRQLSDQVLELSRSNAQLERSEREYASQLESQVQLSHDLSTKIEAALTDIDRLNERAEELHAVKVDRDRLIEELDNRQNEMRRLTLELEKASSADVDLRQRLEQLTQRCAVLDAELQRHGSLNQQASERLRDEEQRRQSLERALADASEELAQLHVERERLEGIEDEVVELDTSRRQLLKDLELAKRERDEAFGAESSTREIVVELRDELTDRLESVQQLEDQRNDAIAQMQKERTERQAAQSEVEAARQEIQTLDEQRLSLQEQRDENVTELERLKAELVTANALYGQVVDQVTMYRQDVQQAQGGGDLNRKPLAQRESTGRAVSGKRANRDLDSARPTKPGFSFRRAQRREEDVRAREKANSYRDQRLGTVYSAAPLRCDDLTRIQGVDHELHGQLNSLGVYTFKQMMEWNAQVIAEFSRRLATDRITKDDWIGQARRLYHRHYPAAA